MRLKLAKLSLAHDATLPPLVREGAIPGISGGSLEETYHMLHIRTNRFGRVNKNVQKEAEVGGS